MTIFVQPYGRQLPFDERSNFPARSVENQEAMCLDFQTENNLTSIQKRITFPLPKRKVLMNNVSNPTVEVWKTIDIRVISGRDQDPIESSRVEVVNRFRIPAALASEGRG